MAPPTKMLDLTEHPKVASSTKTPKPVITFLDLPPEILLMITALLDEKQLPVLRLISKQACSCLSDIFAKVHFAHLRHHLTEPSLHDLIQITSHAMFSTYVKSIEFSTARTKDPSPESSDPLLREDSEFRRAGHHVTMLVTVLENLSHHGNRKVSLGVFDRFYYRMVDELPTINSLPTQSTLLGHGYIKSYGVQNVLTCANPHGTEAGVRTKKAMCELFNLEKLGIVAKDLRDRRKKRIVDIDYEIEEWRGRDDVRLGCSAPRRQARNKMRKSPTREDKMFGELERCLR
ncbi:hypothetical protein KCU64_g4351, partial [Aureobasidium melanogenum]